MHKRWILLIASTALWAACANDKDDPEPDEPPIDCEALDGEACAKESDCQAIVGERVDEEHACKIAEEAVGCLPPNTPCDDAMTFARDHEGSLWWFSNLCVPEGWETTNEGPSDYEGDICGPPNESAECVELSESACAERDDCSRLEGNPVDKDAQCVEPSEYVGCVATPDNCGDAMTLAHDNLGHIWRFSSTCIAEDLVPYAGPDAGELLDAPACDEITEPTACEELDEAACDDRDDCTGLLAQAVNQEDLCLEDATHVGCQDAALNCADQTLVARDADDELWVSPNTCIPNDWQVEEDEDAQEWISSASCDP